MFSRSSANIGDSIYFIALLWTVQVITNSTSATGYVYTAFTIATLFSVMFGPVLDRYNPALIAGIALFAQSLLISCITLAYLNNYSSLILIISLVFVSSIFSSIFYPADNSLFTKIVEENEYLSGNSLISSSDQMVNLLGFLAGGSLITFLGTTTSFAISAATIIIAGITYVVLLKMNPIAKKNKQPIKKVKLTLRMKKYIVELNQGIQFIKTNKFLRLVLPFGAISNAVMAILIIILPSIGVKEGSALYYSGIYVAFFIGFIIGAISTNFLKTNGLTISLAWIGNGLALFLFSFMSNWWLICGTILLFGMFSGVLNIVQNTLIQSMTPPDMMGRVMSALTTLNNIATPIGGLIGGTLALILNLNIIVLLAAVILFLCGFILLVLKSIRNFDLDKAKEVKQDNDLSNVVTVN